MEAKTTPALMIFSGPADKRGQAADALRAATYEIIPDPDGHVLGHGLPSHPDPLTAHANGAPNSGHAPGTLHPEELAFIVAPGEHADDPEHECTKKDCDHVGEIEHRPNLLPHVGEEYEHDPNVGFLTVQGTEVDHAAAAVEPFGWYLRMHTSEVLHVLTEDITPEERMERIEHDLALLKEITKS